MKKFLATAGAIAVLALTSAPAQAASPTTQATATAKIYKPLSKLRVHAVLSLSEDTCGPPEWAARAVVLSFACA